MSRKFNEILLEMAYHPWYMKFLLAMFLICLIGMGVFSDTKWFYFFRGASLPTLIVLVACSICRIFKRKSN